MICIVLAILGSYIKSNKFSMGRRSMWVRISGRQIDTVGTLSSGKVTGGRGWCSGWSWCSGQWWRRIWCKIWCRLSVSVGWRCTYPLMPPASLYILCAAMMTRKAYVRLVLTKHCGVSFCHGFHHFMPSKLNIPVYLLFDFSAWILHQILRFLFCGPQNVAFHHVGHNQGEAHVGLFQLYTTCLPCHSSRHVENLPQISCCFLNCDSASTSPIYTSVVSSQVITDWLVHSRECLWRNSSAQMPELTTSWCSILRTVPIDSIVDHGGFPLQGAINWSRSSLPTPNFRYMVNWRPFTKVWIYWHPIACCFILLLLLVLRTIFQWASIVLCLEAALAASWWTNWCLGSCNVPLSDISKETPVDQLSSDLVYTGWVICVSIICWCGLGEDDDNEIK